MELISINMLRATRWPLTSGLRLKISVAISVNCGCPGVTIWVVFWEWRGWYGAPETIRCFRLLSLMIWEIPSLSACIFWSNKSEQDQTNFSSGIETLIYQSISLTSSNSVNQDRKRRRTCVVSTELWLTVGDWWAFQFNCWVYTCSVSPETGAPKDKGTTSSFSKTMETTNFRSSNKTPECTWIWRTQI